MNDAGATTDAEFTTDAERNRNAWDAASDAYQARHGAQLAGAPEAWGIWSLPERDLQLIGDVAGRDVLEYGCGGAQWSIALAKRGGRCTALDNSARQLEHAARGVAAQGARVTLVHAAAGAAPFPDASFDVVFSDHGAMSFADARPAIAEVARLLRPGGVFAFSREHPIHAIAWDDAANAPSRVAHRSYFESRRIVDPSDGGVSFGGTIAEYVTLLIDHGFVIERLLEPQAPAGAVTTYHGYASYEWARDLPAELMIRARRRA